VLGVSADLISDIGRNMAQIQEIMETMADIAGGEAGRGLIQTQLRNLDQFTASLDQQAESAQKRVPEIWEEIDTRAAHSEKNINEVVEKILSLRPKIDDALNETNKSISSMRASLAKSADS